MSTTSKGRDAEDAVALYLHNHGHKLIEQNWRTRWCEIDVISIKAGKVYFTEVKLRKNDEQGGGFEAINTKKLKQMQFAAEFWLNKNDWQGESQLLAAAVDSTGKVELREIF